MPSTPRSPPSNATLSKALSSLLKKRYQKSQLGDLTAKKVRKELELKFNCSLREKKDWVKTQINSILQKIAEEEAQDSGSESSSDSDDDLSDHYAEEVEKRSTTMSKSAQKRKSSTKTKPAAVKEKGGTPWYVSSTALASFLNTYEISRGDAIKQIRDYLRSNCEKDPKNGHYYLLDDTLREIFKKKKMKLFAIPKEVGKYLKDPQFVSDPKASKKRKRQKAESKSKAKVKEKKKTKKGGDESQSYGALYELSPALSKVCGGAKELTRPQVVKNIHQYADENNLKNPKDRREIHCDKALKKVMDGLDVVTMFSMNKYITKHLTNTGRGKKKKKKEKRKGSGKPVGPQFVLSDILSEVCGDKKEGTRGEVVKWLWVYIKAKNLQDPKDKRNIICDGKLKKIMDNQKVVSCFGMNKYLGAHLTRADGK